MLVVHDRCDSMADGNQADVLEGKHSSCVEPHDMPALTKHAAKGERKIVRFERNDKMTSYNI